MHAAVDFRGDAVSGATARALEHYEAALEDFQSWRGNPAPKVAAALEAAPAFVMAYVLDAYLQVCSRNPAAAELARSTHARIAPLHANRRESLHRAAIAAIARDDYAQARAILGTLLEAYPRDAVALAALQSLDYLTGQSVRMAERMRRVMHAWSPRMPGYHAVLSMRAFAEVERGEYAHAEALATRALALQPEDARAHHAMAHVFDMTGRLGDGIRWLRTYERAWATSPIVARHLWWHRALLELQASGPVAALAVYDTHVRRTRSTAVGDLIDASSLLWRVQLAGGNPRARWQEVAEGWALHVFDAFCTFSDVHAMLAFVGARDWDLAQCLLQVLSERQRLRTRHGVLTRFAGLSACRALVAFGRGDYTTAARLLATVPAVAQRLGGSHTQREVLHLTRLEAVDRSRPIAQAMRAAA